MTPTKNSARGQGHDVFTARFAAGFAACVLFLRGSLFAGLLLAVSSGTFAAGQVDIHAFPTPELEARYKLLIDEFRCPKCLNTNLSGSDAPIAKDLRDTVYRLLVEDAMSDQEIREFLQARYGDFVLYNPPFKPGTWILWLAPVAFVLVGLLVLLRMVRPRPEVTLSAADQERIEQLLRERGS
ncbi:MAG: cytochrome c-type biogenesis protein [Pseudomonadota bacterium]